MILIIAILAICILGLFLKIQSLESEVLSLNKAKEADREQLKNHTALLTNLVEGHNALSEYSKSLNLKKLKPF